MTVTPAALFALVLSDFVLSLLFYRGHELTPLVVILRDDRTERIKTKSQNFLTALRIRIL